MKTYIAVDIGGTQLRAALYPETGIVPINHKRIPTRGKDSAFDRLVGLIREILPEDDQVVGLAAGAPGAIDPKTGTIFYAPNISDWVNFPLKKMLSEEIGLPVSVGNDANMAALGEWKFGAGQGYHDLLYLTISTGIGGGVILDDKLLLGHQGLATELGHTVITPDGPRCGCGQYGHLEAFCSGTAISNYVCEQLSAGKSSILAGNKKPSAREITEAARQGDDLSLKALERAGFYLGIGLANFLHTFNPSIVVLGGGVTQAGNLLLDPMRASLENHVVTRQYIDDLAIRLATLGDDVGLLGALALARSAAE